MKKSVVWFLILCFIIQSFSMLSVFATAEDVSDHLITHWDFEGDTPYADKAVNGTNSDTLTPQGSVTVNGDGTVTVGYQTKSHLKADISEIGSGDLGNLQNKTIVIKVKFDTTGATGTTAVTPFYKVDTARLQVKADTVYFRTWNPAGGNITNDPFSISTADNQYRYFVISYEYSEGAFTEKYYCSKDDQPATSAEFVEMFSKTTENVDASVCKNNTKDILFGSSDNTKIMFSNMIYDDIKIYDIAMTIGQVTVSLGGTDVGVLPPEEGEDENIDTGESDSMSDKLITWWNFNGEMPYADKAGKGASPDKLTAYGNSTVSDGVAYIPNAEGAYLSASGKAGTDLNDFKNKTVVIKMAMKNDEEMRGNFAAIISKNNGFTYGVQNEAYGNRTTMYATVNGVRNSVDGGYNKMNEFRVFVMTFEYDEVEKVLTVNYYMSLNENPTKAEDFKIMLQTSIEVTTDDIIQSTNDIILGRAYNGLTKKINFYAWYDDVKIYSDIMTLDEVVAEVPTSSEYVLPELPEYDVYYEKLEGVTMYAIGDSYFDGPSLGRAKAHPTLIASKYQMGFHNDGIGGSTIANFNGYNESKPPMILRWEKNLPDEEPNIILFEGGANDYGNDIPMGGVDSTDINTFQGAINVMITGLKQKYPNALIICLTPWKSSEAKKTAYATAMIEVCEKRGIPYIDQSDPEAVGVDMTSSAFREKYSEKPTDSSHLNFDGMKFVMPYIEEYIARYYYAFIGEEFVDQTYGEYYKPNYSEIILNMRDDVTDGTEDESNRDEVTDEVTEGGKVETTAPIETESRPTEESTATTTEEKIGCSAFFSGSGVLLVVLCVMAVSVKRRKLEAE